MFRTAYIEMQSKIFNLMPNPELIKFYISDIPTYKKPPEAIPRGLVRTGCILPITDYHSQVVHVR